MKKKLFILPIVASVVFVFLLFVTGCEKKIKHSATLRDYLKGVWVIDSSAITPGMIITNTTEWFVDTLEFRNNIVYCNCGETWLAYTANEDHVIIQTPEGETLDYYVDRISESQMLLQGYSPCHDYTQVVKNSMFNKINQKAL